MPTKSRRAGAGKQELKRRISQQKRKQSYFEKLRNAQKRERDRILLRTIKLANNKGIYNPKEIKLTKYRRYRANKIAQEFGDFLDPTKFFFVKAPSKAKKTVIERAESLQMKHTKSGIFIAKEGHKRATLKTDKKRKEFFIERTGRTKRGPTRGVRYRTITPLASVDELDNERDRLRALADQIGPLKKNERVTFKVIENGLEGYSHHTFSNIELLLNHLENYRKSIPAKVNFFRHIVLEKTTASQWFAEHPATSAGRKGRKQRDEIRQRQKEKPMQMRVKRTRKR